MRKEMPYIGEITVDNRVLVSVVSLLISVGFILYQANRNIDKSSNYNN